MLLTELWHQMCLLPLIQEEQHIELIRHSIGDLQITRRLHKLYIIPLSPLWADFILQARVLYQRPGS